MTQMETGMRDYDLRFYCKSKRWHDGLVNIIESSCEKIPEKPGSYIIGASDNTKFIYPWGASPIYYIGKADNLNKRINDHYKYILRAIEDHEETNWWPRYQYGASFGAKVAWYTVRGKQNPNKLESDIITEFYNTYGSIPIANGMWPSGLRKPSHGARDDE